MNNFHINKNSNKNTSISSKEEEFLECMINYYFFLKTFINDKKSKTLKTEKTYLISKEWFSSFLRYFNKVNIIFQRKEKKTEI